MFAEAENEINGSPTPAAIAAFEEVQKRAFGTNASKIGVTPTTKAAFFDAIVNNKPVQPHAADFEDGYRNAVICDAIIKSAGTRRQVDIEY